MDGSFPYRACACACAESAHRISRPKDPNETRGLSAPYCFWLSGRRRGSNSDRPFTFRQNLLEFISSIDLKTLSETVSGFFGNAVRAEDVENMFSSFLNRDNRCRRVRLRRFSNGGRCTCKSSRTAFVFVAAVMSSYFFAADLPKIKKKRFRGSFRKTDASIISKQKNFFGKTASSFACLYADNGDNVR